MKILSIGNFGHGWDGSICDEEHIASALEELGHEVFRLQREDTQSPKFTASFLKSDTDFVLIAQWDGYPEKLIEHLKFKLSGGEHKIVYWAFDHQDQSQEWHNRLIEGSDLYLSKRIADSKYPNWQWLSQDFAPSFLGKTPTVKKDIDILFTGSWLDWAKERIETLQKVDSEFNLTVHTVNPQAWPQTFKNVNGPIMDEGLPELYARAKVVLSIDHTIEAGYWSDRTAQAMCCGAFVLHRYQPLSSAVFRAYIGYFYDIPTCFRSLEHWLEADEDRENLAGYGYEYAQRELKVRNRVEDLLNIVQGVL